MHFIVNWDIKAPKLTRQKLNREMRACLAGSSWVRPLRGFYIVRVRSALEWNTIVERLKFVAKSHSESIRFVASPLFQGGGYHGWLPRNLWPKVAKRTN